LLQLLHQAGNWPEDLLAVEDYSFLGGVSCVISVLFLESVFNFTLNTHRRNPEDTAVRALYLSRVVDSGKICRVRTGTPITVWEAFGAE
jgi:hypothetical protein